VANVHADRTVIEPEAVGLLVDALRRRGYAVLGPTVRDGAIVYDELEHADDLPVGWTDTQDGGTYRLERRDDEARFGYAVGPHSWKQFLFPPRVRLWQASRDGSGRIEVEEEPHDGPPLALFGVRSCELHAIAIQDRVFVGGRVVDRDYAARRENVFVVAVNCFEPGGTCFCVSMGTGPEVESGYDLVLTEILEDGHRLLVEAGSARGAEIVHELPARPAAPSDLAAAERAVDAARGKMGRHMEASDLRDLLARNLEHPRWDDVAERCLTCGNCTLVCPTCFCSTVEEVSDLEGAHAERWREWD
jgi:sulfhydrogenase subunit beta (sulfur reductase)